MQVPETLKYTKDHEWLRIEGNTATVGITDFAQHELGDIVYVEVSGLNKPLNEGEVFGTVEAVKTVSDLFLPVSGTVTEHRSNCEVPIVHKAGDTVAEFGDFSHWWKNTGNKPAVLLSADVFHSGMMDDHMM